MQYIFFTIWHPSWELPVVSLDFRIQIKVLVLLMVVLSSHWYLGLERTICLESAPSANNEHMYLLFISGFL